MVGPPNSDDWEQVQKEAVECLTDVREMGIRDQALHDDDLKHRRGHFAALASGISFGGGRTVSIIELQAERDYILSIHSASWQYFSPHHHAAKDCAHASQKSGRETYCWVSIK